MMARTRTYGPVSAMIACTVILSGCSGTEAQSHPTFAPHPSEAQEPLFRVGTRWISAGPDLLSPDGTFVRAFEESINSSVNTGTESAVYPGFLDASSKAFTFSDWVFLTPIDKYPYSVAFMELVRVNQLADGTTAAVICSWLRDGHARSPLLLEYRKEGVAPPSGQRGPADRPTTDVFGGWYATKRSSVSPSDPDHNACDTAPPEFAGSFNQHQDLPSVPGWKG